MSVYRRNLLTWPNGSEVVCVREQADWARPMHPTDFDFSFGTVVAPFVQGDHHADEFSFTDRDD